MTALDRLWAGWRAAFVNGPRPADGECVFCRILSSGEPDRSTYVVRRGRQAVAILNLYPYNSGHVMVMPTRHVAELEELEPTEATELWAMLADAVRAVKAAYRPHGVNIGANLGEVAGAGVPGHFHLHCVPRWSADTNFMTVVAEARVLPEPLSDTFARLSEAWPPEPGAA